DIYPSLERVCLEGTRAQSKLAVSAIAALIDTSEKSILLELCKEEMSSDIGSSDENSECSFSCKIKIFGLKALVKSFLPHQNIQVNRKSNELLEVILQMLQKGDVSDCLISCETDKAHIRLAAAKSVLRLSKRWDLHISPLIFRLTVLMAKVSYDILQDPSSLVRRSFVRKIYKLLKEHAFPKRYACAFALAASDALKDLQEDAHKYMAEFVKEYTREAQIKQTLGANGGVTDYPMYIVVYLIHVLAHDSGFPPEDYEDEDIYAQFCGWAFLNAGFVDDVKGLAKSAGSSLRSILIAIKRAEDAVDAQLTPADLSGSGRKIAEKMLQSAKSQISRAAGNLTKRGRKCQEISSKSDVAKCSTMNISLSTKFSLSSSERREQGKGLYAHGTKSYETLKSNSASLKKNDTIIKCSSSRLAPPKLSQATNADFCNAKACCFSTSADIARCSDRGMHFSVSSSGEMDDKFSTHAPQQIKKEKANMFNDKNPFDVSLGTSASEIIATNEDAIAQRMRRRKLLN
ncbi:hypothetical protein RJ639_045864, partial [Escallonia herrerae]